MNKELLLKIKEHILAEPKRLIMDDVAFRGRPGERVYDGGISFEIADCGTAACIAGWACLLSDERPSLWYGERLLRLNYPEKHYLFFASSWPTKFYHRWRNANTPQERAVIAAERIDHFIEHGK